MKSSISPNASLEIVRFHLRFRPVPQCNFAISLKASHGSTSGSARFRDVTLLCRLRLPAVPLRFRLVPRCDFAISFKSSRGSSPAPPGSAYPRLCYAQIAC